LFDKGGCIVRIVPAAVIVLLLAVPELARGQGVSLRGAGGPTLGDSGSSVMAGIGLSPASRVTFVVGVERSHLESRRDEHDGVISYFRGGTFTMASAEVQVALFAPDRVGPYGLAGFAIGRSRPNVNDVFPTPADSSVGAPFAGGGLHAPLGPNLAVFADLRLTLVVGTDSDDLYALAPLRAGLSWRF
jgi:hypothetical protein